jgi:hypothetical protein
MTRYLYHATFLTLVLGLGACSVFQDKNETKDNNTVPELSSSSSAIIDSGRVEIEYGDTLQIKDSASYRMPDSLLESSHWNVFIGKLPKGSVIHIALKNANLTTGTQFRVRSESSVIQLPTDTISDGSYQDYAVASDTSYLSNHFITLDSGYYYLEINGERKSTAKPNAADFRASMSIDSAYFQFTGHEDSTELPANVAFQGFFRLSEGEDSTQFYFAAGVGKNLTIVSQGQSLDEVRLLDSSGKTIDSAVTEIRHQLLPQDSTRWSVRIRSTLPSYYSGNYAFFTLNLSSIQLGKGEYFAKPDTMPRAGDTLIINRVGNASSGWDVRHDHYIWLGNLVAKDTVILWHGSSGIERVLKTLQVLDSEGNAVDTLAGTLSTNWAKQQGNVFVPSKSGNYYLHFSGTGNESTYWTDENYTLHLLAMIQKPHTIETFNYNPATFGYITEFTVGDTLDLNELLDFDSVKPSSSSHNYLPLVVRSERNILQDSLDIVFGNSASGDEVRSHWMIAEQPGIANLLLQSTADPTKMDTCKVKVVAP